MEVEQEEVEMGVEGISKEAVAEMGLVEKSTVVAQMGLVEKSKVGAQMGLEEETMEVGKRTSCLLYFAFCILMIVASCVGSEPDFLF